MISMLYLETTRGKQPELLYGWRICQIVSLIITQSHNNKKKIQCKFYLRWHKLTEIWMVCDPLIKIWTKKVTFVDESQIEYEIWIFPTSSNIIWCDGESVILAILTESMCELLLMNSGLWLFYKPWRKKKDKRAAGKLKTQKMKVCTTAQTEQPAKPCSGRWQPEVRCSWATVLFQITLWNTTNSDRKDLLHLILIKGDLEGILSVKLMYFGQKGTATKIVLNRWNISKLRKHCHLFKTLNKKQIELDTASNTAWRWLLMRTLKSDGLWLFVSTLLTLHWPLLLLENN